MNPPIGREPSFEEKQYLKKQLPNLVDGEWKKTGDATGIFGPNAYNCYAWSLCRDDVGWIEQIVDALGDNNNSLGINDFDKFYLNKKYHVCGHSIKDCKSEFGKHKIALFCKGGKPTHAAKESEHQGWWESKLGEYIRILHKLEQLEGQTYGVVCRCYCLDSADEI